MNKHIVNHADGIPSTRNSKNRIYTHAVVQGGESGWVVRWCGSEQLAKKAMVDARKYTTQSLHIAEVTLLDN